MKLHASLLVDLKGVGKAEPSTEPRRRGVGGRLRARPHPPAWIYWCAAAGVLAVVLAGALLYAQSRPRPTSLTGRQGAASEEPSPAPIPDEPPRRPVPRVEEQPPPLPPPAPEPPPEKAIPPAPPPAPAPEPPAPQPEKPAPLPPPPTAVALATVESVEGDVYVLTGSPAERTSARAGRSLLAGEGLATEGKAGRAIVKYPDSTRLELGPDSIASEFKDGSAGRGKIVRLDSGTLSATVTPQPSKRPLVFVTPHAESTVLGTSLRLVVDGPSTRLEVEEGKVRITRVKDGAATDVSAGHFAIAGPGIPLQAKLIPYDDIVLRPQDGRIAGQDWQRVADRDASAGQALEAPRVENDGHLQIGKPSKGYVEFRFKANASRSYHVWVRGRCTAEKDPRSHDAVGLTVVNGVWNVRGWDGVGAAFFNGFGRQPGYSWYGGDEKLTTVRFAREGAQTLRLYGAETPMRVDVIWLSATQETLPPPEQHGPRSAEK